MIELLVAIAIIAALASLLLPALASAKAKGQLAKCLSNQHQIGIAFVLYADEHGESCPMTWGWNAHGGTNGAVNDHHGGEAKPEQRLLNAYAPGLSIFHCPADRGDSFYPQKSAWHNRVGVRRQAMLFEDAHSEFYRFPKEMDVPAIAFFVAEEDVRNPYYPNPSFYWW